MLFKLLNLNIILKKITKIKFNNLININLVLI
jgi:hypothetical protein